MEVPETLKPKPASPLEIAKREYHLATVAMGELDAKVIDAAATLDELREAYGKSITRVNQARDALIEARTPPPADEARDARRMSDREYFEALHAEINGKSREFVITRLSEEDLKRIRAMVKWNSPLKERAEILLAFVEGTDVERAAECGQPVPGANGHAEDFEPPPPAA